MITRLKHDARSLVRAILLLLPLALLAPAEAAAQGTAKAVLAGGCFWCLEEAMEKLPGVIGAVSGYIGSEKKNPTYEEVSRGATGHTEAVEVTFDPSRISYQKLLEAFWVNHDPTVIDRQFCDIGSQYRPSIFYLGDEQKRIAEASRASTEKSKPFKEAIRTPIVAAGEFWPAEDYHQDYYKKNPLRYSYYKTSCGRVARLEQLWGKR